MKKLDLPFIDDFGILDELASNAQLCSYPFLVNSSRTIKQQYRNYVANSGDPHLCNQSGISDDLKAALRQHYSDPPIPLSFIKQIRDGSSPNVCPMCGSQKTGTLDHLLPAADYPDWSIFSANLVPACDCNVKRQNVVKGIHPNERVLHPYFDNCLNNRLISCRFGGNLEIPEVSIVNINNNPDVEFHIRKVVQESSTLVQWLEGRWSLLKKTPELIIDQLPRNKILNRAEVSDAIDQCLSDKDLLLETPNNWESIFFHGLKESQGVIDWIVSRNNGIVNGTIDRLS